MEYSPAKMKPYRRITVKVGSSILFDEKGEIDLPFLQGLAQEIADFWKKGGEVVLVSSGAIRMGRKEISTRGEEIPSKQALAAVGQIKLMNLYQGVFQPYGIACAQVLLTRTDFSLRSSYLNARNTISTLLSLRILPIINENDSVAVEEIKFGDNDTLSALVASLIEADFLVILSDVDGLYTHDPKKDPRARLVKKVEKINEKIKKLAFLALVEGRVGGMQTKIQAAEIGTNSGIPVVIGNGRKRDFLKTVLEGKEAGTLFLPTRTKPSARKRWIAYAQLPQGEVIVDEGAKEAMVKKGGSLLPAGILEVKGEFEAGDTVSVRDREGREIARGITYYSSREIEKIKGLKSYEVGEVLGYKYYDEVIHRDNLVLV